MVSRARSRCAGLRWPVHRPARFSRRSVSDSTARTRRDAAAAILDAQGRLGSGQRRALGRKACLSTGVLIGIGLDLSTTNYHLRWSLAGQARRWNRDLALGFLTMSSITGSTSSKPRLVPRVSANRTIGSLGGMVASRVARELRIGGPSFTVSCDETSGMQALAIAAKWLERRELDAAIVGAVDFAGDVRVVLARQELGRTRERGRRSCAAPV